ncbi:hypothetical protein SNEBB_008986 [Seison nebaliae]|nr:hypothetical protein SNEBB_008986 [Seison nebaliae]
MDATTCMNTCFTKKPCRPHLMGADTACFSLHRPSPNVNYHCHQKCGAFARLSFWCPNNNPRKHNFERYPCTYCHNKNL